MEVRKAPHDPVPTVADAAFYERLDATLSPGTIAVAMALQEAAYRGRRDPDDMPTYPYPLFKAMAATIMTDPRVLESISMAVSLDQMIAEAAGPAEVPVMDYATALADQEATDEWLARRESEE